MARHNLVIKIGTEPFYFYVDESALDYFQQSETDPNECFPTLLNFLKTCKEDGSIVLNLNELSCLKIQLLIPERNIDFFVQQQNVDWDCISSSSDDENDEKLDETCNSISVNDKPLNSCEDMKEAVSSNSIWTEGITKFMLEQYGKCMNYVGPMKKFKRKVEMWKHLSDKIEKEFSVKFTYIQVENRYKTVCKRKKIIIDNNRSTGASRMDDAYEKEWNNITKHDDSILPEVLRSAKTVVINKKNNPEPPSKKPKTDSAQQILIKYLHEKEIAKERRHKEKMDLLKSIFNKEI